jgi:glycolate oxidase iron-sulfur subunit
MSNDEIVNRCIRCGRCMAVCPVYQTTFHEADVARGRLAVLEQMKDLAGPPTQRMRDILSRCLLCGACAEVCANNVPTTSIIQESRAALVRKGQGLQAGYPLLTSLRKGGMAGEIVSKGGALLEALFCRKIPETSGLHLRFPLSFFSKRSTIPSIAWTPFLKNHRPQGEKAPRRMRVGFFVGCGANYLFPDTAVSLVRILDEMGVDTVMPQGQGCCGLAAFVSGDTDTARALALRNIEAFAALEVDAVLSVCASCGALLQEMSRIYQDDPILESGARWISRKHRDATSFLMEELGLESYLRQRVAAEEGTDGSLLRVAYHDPCHLRIAQGVSDAPRRMIKAVPGVQLADAPPKPMCCGHGGDFNLLHFELSMDILDRRMDELLKAEPDAIVTGCTGCLLQLLEGVGRRGLSEKVSVFHPLVLVARTIARPGAA